MINRLRTDVTVALFFAAIAGVNASCIFGGGSTSDNATPTPVVTPANPTVSSPSPPASAPTPIARPSNVESTSGISSFTTPVPTSTSNPSQTNDIIIPVEGVRPEELRDTFEDARSQGRVHDAIDIPAPHNTPVLAAGDGRTVKLFHSERGGTTIYQLMPDDRTVYYYAHLDHYADGLVEGHFARQGEVIAYVGDTGDAGPGKYHLHFSISIVANPKRYWDGVNINPYPLLHK